MGNGREHGAGQQEHGQDQGDSQDGGRGADHPRDEGGEGGASESVSSPLLNSSTTLLGQTTMRNCNAIPVGVSLKLSFHVIVYKNTLHAFTLPLHCCNCYYYILDPFSPLNRSISWLTCFTLK